MSAGDGDSLKTFYYYLTIPGEYQHLHSDMVRARDKKEARKIIEEENHCTIAEKISRKSSNKIDYRVFIVELNDYWEKHWLSVRICKSCQTEYTLLFNKQSNGSGNPEFCSYKCRNADKPLRIITEDPGIHNPVIYKITNKNSKNSYIGQTTQAVTYRWYQHFYSPGDTKFHKEIKETSFTDWMFEVLEVLPKGSAKDLIDSREKHYILLYNGEGFGLNTQIPKEDADTKKDDECA